MVSQEYYKKKTLLKTNKKIFLDKHSDKKIFFNVYHENIQNLSFVQSVLHNDFSSDCLLKMTQFVVTSMTHFVSLLLCRP